MVSRCGAGGGLGEGGVEVAAAESAPTIAWKEPISQNSVVSRATGALEVERELRQGFMGKNKGQE